MPGAKEKTLAYQETITPDKELMLDAKE